MAIGYNWAEGSYADTSWALGAWREVPLITYVPEARIQAIMGAIRMHPIIGVPRTQSVRGASRTDIITYNRK